MFSSFQDCAANFFAFMSQSMTNANNSTRALSDDSDQPRHLLSECLLIAQSVAKGRMYLRISSQESNRIIWVCRLILVIARHRCHSGLIKPTIVVFRPAKIQISMGIRPILIRVFLNAQSVAKGTSYLQLTHEKYNSIMLVCRLIWVIAWCRCNFVGLSGTVSSFCMTKLTIWFSTQRILGSAWANLPLTSSYKSNRIGLMYRLIRVIAGRSIKNLLP